MSLDETAEQKDGVVGEPLILPPNDFLSLLTCKLATAHVVIKYKYKYKYIEHLGLSDLALSLLFH